MFAKLTLLIWPWRAWALIFGVALAQAQAATGVVSREHQLKCVLLYNITQLTDWPTNSFAAPDSPLIIGIVGENPFGQILEETVRDERAHGRPLRVQRYAAADPAKNCHLLFIPRTEKSRLREILAQLEGRPILTVSDLENPAPERIMVLLLTEQNRIRLNINEPAAKAAGLQLSERLLRVARK